MSTFIGIYFNIEVIKFPLYINFPWSGSLDGPKNTAHNIERNLLIILNVLNIYEHEFHEQNEQILLRFLKA